MRPQGPTAILGPQHETNNKVRVHENVMGRDPVSGEGELIFIFFLRFLPPTAQSFAVGATALRGCGV